MELIFTYAFGTFMTILFAYVCIKLTIKRYRKPKSATGIIISKDSSEADEFSVSKGYMNSNEIYTVQIKCNDKNKSFRTSKVMYELLEANQKISFEYSGDTLYNFEVLA